MIRIYTDGGSRGNPGKSACAFLIIKEDKEVYSISKFLGIKTNNEAEYHAIINALNWVENNKEDKEIKLFSDSELVIKQINGEYKIKKTHLKELNKKVRDLIEENDFDIKFSNVKRENRFISQADFLLNNELDKN
jgi:ribonuclease HI